MKKLASYFLMVMGVIFLFKLFCNYLNYFPSELKEEYSRLLKEADEVLKNSELEDERSFREELRFIADSIDWRREYYIVLLYKDYRNRVTAIPRIVGKEKGVNNIKFREMFEARFCTEAIDYLENDYSYKDYNGSLIAAILGWKKEALFGKDIEYAICDIDCDGSWDEGTTETKPYFIAGFKGVLEGARAEEVEEDYLPVFNSSGVHFFGETEGAGSMKYYERILS